jgi:predicted DNA-binding protein YlxM (UPF0122 family)
MRKRTDAAQRLTAERDQLILEGYEAGVDVRQMAGQLGISREAVYLVIRRSAKEAREEREAAIRLHERLTDSSGLVLLPDNQQEES